MPRPPRAFTLIELLVVVTIIVILLALLTPALDKAIYQAELLTCSARLKAVASGAIVYAADFKRFYPDRPNANGGWLTTDLRYQNNGDFDDRPVLKNHIPLNTFVDPLVKQIDLTLPSARIQSSFTSLWFDTQYPNERGMHKLGDRFTWTGKSATNQPEVYTLNLLASDSDYYTDQNALTMYSSHVDEKGVMSNSYLDDTNFRVSYWAVSTVIRGVVDFNYAFADGSVSRLERVKTNRGLGEEDERVVRVPILYSATSAAAWYQQVPRP